MAHFLGVDIGGSVIKSGLYDEHGVEKAVAFETRTMPTEKLLMSLACVSTST